MDVLLTIEDKKGIIEKYKQHENDTGSPEVQIALLTGRIQYLTDPAVVGGVRVQVGDTVIDGTIATRLADLRLQLAG